MMKVPTTFRVLRISLAAVCLSLAAAAPARANLILNSGFESGDFTSWTTTSSPSGSFFFVAGHAHSGSSAAWFGGLGRTDDRVSETFDTVAGQEYVLDFWLGHGLTDRQNDFNVSWGTTTLLHLVNAPKFGYRHYSFTETAVGSSTTLTFGGRDMLDYFFLDDISVTAAPIPTPEPASVALVGAGIVLLARRCRSRRF